MTLDEYEAIRLLDLENLQQEQAAAQMGVARTTVQLIYNNARRKLADCLVNGKRLVIEGGRRDGGTSLSAPGASGNAGLFGGHAV